MSYYFLDEQVSRVNEAFELQLARLMRNLFTRENFLFLGVAFFSKEKMDLQSAILVQFFSQQIKNAFEKAKSQTLAKTVLQAQKDFINPSYGHKSCDNGFRRRSWKCSIYFTKRKLLSWIMELVILNAGTIQGSWMFKFVLEHPVVQIRFFKASPIVILFFGIPLRLKKKESPSVSGFSRVPSMFSPMPLEVNICTSISSPSQEKKRNYSLSFTNQQLLLLVKKSNG